MIFLKVALLNIRSHWKRTAVILFAIGLSVTVMIFVESLMVGIKASFFQGIYQDSGHLQIHKKGYSDALETYPINYTIPDPSQVIDKIKGKDGVTAAEPMILFGCLAFHQDKNIPTTGIGVIQNSYYYTKAIDGIVEGSALDRGDEILISRKMSQLLEVSPDDPVILLAEDSTGRSFSKEFPVTGLYDTENQQFDTNHIFITHGAAQELLNLTNKTLEIRVNIKNPEQAAEFKNTIGPILEAQNLEAETWREIHGSFIVAFELFDLFIWFIDLLVIIVTATVITNAILMNVFERTGEYGSLRAIGLKKRQQAGMILTEGSLLGILGSFLGLIIGIPLTMIVERVGINVGNFTESFGLSRIVYPELNVITGIRSFAAGIIVATAGSLYAALVSSRKQITEMLMGSV